MEDEKQTRHVQMPSTGLHWWPWIVFAVNTAGFLVYLAWLMSGAQRIFYTQDGILYLLPCLPFFFVYAILFGQRRQATSPKEDEHG